jgi:hypothetical protein
LHLAIGLWVHALDADRHHGARRGIQLTEHGEGGCGVWLPLPRPEPNASPTRWHRYANRALTSLSNHFSKLYLTDIETGFKMFRREVIQALTTEEDRFGWDPEVVAKIARMKLRIKEVPISYRGRSFEGQEDRLA